MSANVEVRVRQLVLHDVDPRDHEAVIAALRSELARLLADQPPQRGVSRGEVDVRVDVREDDPRALGISAAGAVHRELLR
jgi:hypothetical protein